MAGMANNESLVEDAEKGDDNRDATTSSGGATVSSGVYNLTTTIVGAGIMALPAAMAVTGLPLGLLLLVAMGCLSEYSIQLLLRSSFSVKVTSYAEVMALHFGRKGRILTQAFVIIYTLGILVIYLIIIADVLSGSGPSRGLLEDWLDGSHWWTSRPSVILACVVILSPLVALEHVDSLHWTSFFAILLAGIFLFVTIGVCLGKLFRGSVSMSVLRWFPSFATWQSVLNLFSVIPTIMTAYVCHFNVHPIYLEMSPPKEDKMQKVVKISLFLCTALYSVTGFFGYLLFGNNVQTDLLVNFNSPLGIAGSQVLCDIVRLTFAVHLLLVFPVLHFALRAAITEMFFSSRRKFPITPIIMFMVSLLAVFIPNIQTVISFAGSLSAVSLSFTLPGLLVLSGTSGVFNRGDRLSAYFMVALGLICTILGLISNFYIVFL